MSEISLGLWLVGGLLIGLAALNIRLPFARMRELDSLADNARRYESWRGGSRTAAAGNGPSSADVLRDMLRRQVYRWAGVGALGVLLVLVGFFLR